MSDLEHLLETTTTTSSNLVENAIERLGCNSVSMSTVEFVLKCKQEIRTTDIKLDTEGDAFVATRILSKSECQRICNALSRHEKMKPIKKMKRSYRVCDRLQVLLPEYSKEIFETLKPVLWRRGMFEIVYPKSRGYAFSGKWRAVGLNESWRFVRYKVGGHFASHVDGSYVANSERRSLYTLNIYLNDLEEDAGGETVFCGKDQELSYDKDEKRYGTDMSRIVASVKPRAGHGLIFTQAPFELLHAGVPLKKGLKFLARTDIMYVRDESTRPRLSEKQQKGMGLLRKAKEAEASGRFGVAMRYYSKAFMLWPELEEGDGAIAGI